MYSYQGYSTRMIKYEGAVTAEWVSLESQRTYLKLTGKPLRTTILHYDEVFFEFKKNQF